MEDDCVFDDTAEVEETRAVISTALAVHGQSHEQVWLNLSLRNNAMPLQVTLGGKRVTVIIKWDPVSGLIFAYQPGKKLKTALCIRAGCKDFCTGNRRLLCRTHFETALANVEYSKDEELIQATDRLEKKFRLLRQTCEDMIPKQRFSDKEYWIIDKIGETLNVASRYVCTVPWHVSTNFDRKFRAKLLEFLKYRILFVENNMLTNIDGKLAYRTVAMGREVWRILCSFEEKGSENCCYIPSCNFTKICRLHMMGFGRWIPEVCNIILGALGAKSTAELEDYDQYRFLNILCHLPERKMQIADELCIQMDGLEAVVKKSRMLYKICFNFEVGCINLYRSNESCHKCRNKVMYVASLSYLRSQKMYGIRVSSVAAGHEYNLKRLILKRSPSEYKIDDLDIIFKMEVLNCRTTANSYASACLLILLMKQYALRIPVNFFTYHTPIGTNLWRIAFDMLKEFGINFEGNILDKQHLKHLCVDPDYIPFIATERPVHADVAPYIYEKILRDLTYIGLSMNQAFSDKQTVAAKYHFSNARDKSMYRFVHESDKDAVAIAWLARIGCTGEAMESVCMFAKVYDYEFNPDEKTMECKPELVNMWLSTTKFPTTIFYDLQVLMLAFSGHTIDIDFGDTAKWERIFRPE